MAKGSVRHEGQSPVDGRPLAMGCCGVQGNAEFSEAFAQLIGDGTGAFG